MSHWYHAPWIDSLPSTNLGSLVLGYGFVWSDLACYAVGVGLGAALEMVTSRIMVIGREQDPD